MKFIQEGPDAAVAKVVSAITKGIQANEPTIWLVCGGSNIPLEVEIMKRVAVAAPDHLGSLLVLPMDERFGPAGHTDSNYQQLKDAGFSPGDALWLDVLGRNAPMQETVDYYGSMVEAAFASAKSIIGVFGLGADGHTAGVLPESPAITDVATTVVGYDSPPYIRLTLTPSLLCRTTTAFVLAYGTSKKEALKRLKANKEDMLHLPAKLLYDIEEVFVYSDPAAKSKPVKKGAKK